MSEEIIMKVDEIWRNYYEISLRAHELSAGAKNVNGHGLYQKIEVAFPQQSGVKQCI